MGDMIVDKGALQTEAIASYFSLHKASHAFLENEIEEIHLMVT